MAKQNKGDSQLAKCRRIDISPQNAIIDEGTTQSYFCEAFDKQGNSLGDITTLVQFTISQGADGSWQNSIYISGSPGLWTITARFRRHIARTLLTINETPEPLPPPPPPQLVIPDSFEGRLFQSLGRMIGEYEGVLAIPYRSYQDYKNYLHVVSNGEGRDYLLPDSDGMNSASVCTVMTATDEIWIAFGLPIKVNQYHIGGDSITLVSVSTLGDSKSRLIDLIKLADGKLFIAWYQWELNRFDTEGNRGMDIGFAYRDLDWRVLPYTWLYPIQFAPSSHAAICQHPDDGSVWWFSEPDGRGTIYVIHLVESGDEMLVDWINYNFLNKYDGAMAPEGELPFFSAVADKSRNAIVLAYQSRDRQTFSVDPFCKGAKPVLIQVNKDASKSLLFVLDRWVERANPLYIGLSDEVWLAYGRIDEVNFTWDDLYISMENKDKYCGKLQGGIPKNQGVRMCNSSKMAIATMDDGYIHFFIPAML